MTPKIGEYKVNTSVDDWIEVKVSHDIINQEFIELLIPSLRRLKEVKKCYKAHNDLIRLDVKGLTPDTGWKYHNDIAIHPKDGHFIIMRNENPEFKAIEDKIINFIIKKIKEKDE